MNDELQMIGYQLPKIKRDGKCSTFWKKWNAIYSLIAIKWLYL